MNILILGAGLMQKPAILAAKELGYKACVIDADDTAVAIPFADVFKKIDLKDREGILAYAKELHNNEGLAAVFTAGTDFSASVSYVTQELKLPAHSFEAACNASSKTRMRSCFEKAGVPSPKYTGVNRHFLENPLSYEEFTSRYFSDTDTVLVVKPIDNMGGRGCRMVRNALEFIPAIKDAVSNSKSGNAVVEEYMDGEEYSIDALVFDGQLIVTGFALRHIKYPPYFIEVGHTMSAELDKDIHDELISTFALGVKALGLTHGVAKADIKYTKKGAMIGEIAGRLSGGYMSGWTFPYASGLNLTKNALLLALGKQPEEALKLKIPVDFKAPKLNPSAQKPMELFEIPCSNFSAERAWISIPGTVKDVLNLDKARNIPCIKDVMERATVKKGGKVDFPRNNVSKCGNVITQNSTYQEAVDTAEKAVSSIIIELEKNNPETDRFLKGESADYEKAFPPSAYEIDSETVLNIDGICPENEKISLYLSEDFKNGRYSKVKDWNYNTVLETVEKVSLLRPCHPSFKLADFYKCLFRGGIQGALYFLDCL